MKELEHRIGQLFIVGFADEQPTRTFLSFLADEQIGGVILFEENCRTHELARENIVAVKSLYGSSTPLIAIDQEGGRVCRLKGAPAEYRAAAEYGRDNRLGQFAEDFRRSAVFLESL
ncbi:MAG: glycoside hydrolase family 3 N-terminal domain-containing protein, partial [Candidatus Zixiibacteriota bacterium]